MVSGDPGAAWTARACRATRSWLPCPTSRLLESPPTTAAASAVFMSAPASAGEKGRSRDNNLHRSLCRALPVENWTSAMI